MCTVGSIYGGKLGVDIDRCPFWYVLMYAERLLACTL